MTPECEETVGAPRATLNEAGERLSSSRDRPNRVIDQDRPIGPWGRTSGLADGIVVTPSHNPPEDGGFKYNPPHGGPADTHVTGWIQDQANALLAGGLAGVERIPFERARRAPTTHRFDYMGGYIADLGSVVDLDVVRGAQVTLAVDPLGGAGVRYWSMIGDRYRLPMTVGSASSASSADISSIPCQSIARQKPSPSLVWSSARETDGPRLASLLGTTS